MRRILLALCLVTSAGCAAAARLGVLRDAGLRVAGTTPHRVAVGSATRAFLLHVPDMLLAPRADSAPVALVIVLHGSGGSGEDIRRASRFDVMADAHGLLVAYPEGSKGRFGLFASDWNAGLCCGRASRDNVDDVEFIRHVIDRVAADFPVDRRRVYVAGFSDGGRLAYHIACTSADRIAAIGVVSGSLVNERCDAVRPVPVIAFHGTSDPEVPYDEPSGTPFRSHVPAAALILPPSARFWVSRNACATATVQEAAPHVTNVFASDCSENADVGFFSIAGGVHAWPDEPPPGAGAERLESEIDATAVMMRFFLAHPRRD